MKVAIRGGVPARPAFWPETCTIGVDLRLPPKCRSSASTLRCPGRGRAHRGPPGRDGVGLEQVVAVPGATTSPDAPVVRKRRLRLGGADRPRCEPRPETSGYTDAAALRAAEVEHRPGRDASSTPAHRRSVLDGRPSAPPSLLTLAEYY